MQKRSLSARIVFMQKTPITKDSADTSIEKMFEAGAQYGYSKTRRHPSISPFIHTTKNRTDIIDLEKTSLLTETAIEFAKSLGAQKKVLLFVGTKPEAKEAVKEVTLSIGMPYVTERWIGGTLSNFSEIKKRITELENYQKENKEGGLEKYTKKERLVLSKKMERLARYYTGLLGLKKLPDALFIVDAKAEHIAEREARGMGIPVIALINSDSNIKNINYPIVGNDGAVPSVRLFTKAIADAYKKGGESLPEKVS